MLASLIAFILRRRVRDGAAKPDIDNLVARIKAWWVIVIVAGGALLAGEHVFIVLFAFVSLAALREFITVTATGRVGLRRAVLKFLCRTADTIRLDLGGLVRFLRRSNPRVCFLDSADRLSGVWLTLETFWREHRKRNGA